MSFFSQRNPRRPETLPFLVNAAQTEIHPGCRDRAEAAADAIVGKTFGSDHRGRLEFIKKHHPEWLRFFREQSRTNPDYLRLLAFFAGGVLFVILLMRVLWSWF